MDVLVSYLIENNYADTQQSAENILASISNSFYQEIQENATKKLADLNQQFRSAMKSGNQADINKFAAQLKAAKEASSQEYKDKGSPVAPSAPRTRGESPQTPIGGRKAAPDPREGHRNRNIEKEADTMIGKSVTNPSYLSPKVPAHLQKQGANNLWAADRRGERRGITGQTNREKRSGAIGKNENPNRFD